MEPIIPIILASSKLIYAICMVESNHRNIISFQDGGSPSYGFCQVKHTTAKFIARKYRLKYHISDLLTPTKNMMIASHYIQYQLERYKGRVECAIEAYNKGSAKKCTGRYVNKVISLLGGQDDQ
jgi:soluble lytic murein transglycosylase-like protein